MYKVFQIKLSDEVTDFVNSNDRGHTGAAEKYPEYKNFFKLKPLKEERMENTNE